jgi:hypothetical protein
MKEMKFYEPAMCCPTGLCGVSVDEELLRISSVIKYLETNEADKVKVSRFNLSGNLQAFIENPVIEKVMMNEGAEVFPVTLIDDQIVKKGSYPSNEELSELLGVSFPAVGEKLPKEKRKLVRKAAPKKVSTNESCDCEGGCC